MHWAADHPSESEMGRSQRHHFHCPPPYRCGQEETSRRDRVKPCRENLRGAGYMSGRASRPIRIANGTFTVLAPLRTSRDQGNPRGRFRKNAITPTCFTAFRVTSPTVIAQAPLAVRARLCRRSASSASRNPVTRPFRICHQTRPLASAPWHAPPPAASSWARRRPRLTSSPARCEAPAALRRSG
jgi:hypothetical protein